MEGAPNASEAAPEDTAARDSVQQTALCNIAVDHAGGIELTSMDSFVSTPVTGVQGARGLPEGRLSPIFDNGTAGNDDAMMLAANGGTECDVATLLDTKGGDTDRDVPEPDDGLPRQGNGRKCVHSALLHAIRRKNG